MPHPSNSTIVHAVAGNRSAQTELITRYRPLIRNAARREIEARFKPRFDESDVVQLTCLDAYTSFSAFRGTSHVELTSWLKGILRRNLWTLYRRHLAGKRDLRREAMVDGGGPLPIADDARGRTEGPYTKLLRGEISQRLATALATLPTDQRQALELRFMKGLKIREVAATLDKSPGAAAGLLRRGLEQLQRAMGKEPNQDATRITAVGN